MHTEQFVLVKRIVIFAYRLSFIDANFRRVHLEARDSSNRSHILKVYLHEQVRERGRGREGREREGRERGEAGTERGEAGTERERVREGGRERGGRERGR